MITNLCSTDFRVVQSNYLSRLPGIGKIFHQRVCDFVFGKLNLSKVHFRENRISSQLLNMGHIRYFPYATFLWQSDGHRIDMAYYSHQGLMFRFQFKTESILPALDRFFYTLVVVDLKALLSIDSKIHCSIARCKNTSI